MALSVVRKGVASLTSNAGRNLTCPTVIIRPQVATIVSKAMRVKDYKRPLPFPYTAQKYGFIQALFDKTTHRFDENTKVIVVDGPIAVGKTKFAKVVAEDLDMLYVPEANMDMAYINGYGYDLRKLDPDLPESCRSFDEKNFLRNPKHPNVAAFQIEMFQLRLMQYVEALGHVLSTGQGVVMDRSVYSDMVFASTLTQFGYMSKESLHCYNEIRKMTIPQLMRPHLVIYLDIPVDVCLERIKARNLPHEINSSVLTPEFLAHMETVYKQHYLKEISNHAEVLVYNWSDEGDAEVVVEDIECVNFDFERNEAKMSDWHQENEWAWCNKRMEYTKSKHFFLRWTAIPYLGAKELIVPAEDHKIFKDVWYAAPGQKYSEGYNKDMGDSALLTKVGEARY